jgi:hypothetical protein
MTRTPLTLVTEQFPDLRQEVACLFERDEVFRELCEDYEACILALARQESNEALRREYAALRLRLETELLGRLHDAEEPGTRK